MKSFEERKTLIYERSEEIKRTKRLKQNGAIFCICLGLVCITIVFITNVGDKVYTNNMPDAQSGNTDGSIADDNERAQDNFGYCGNTMTTIYIGTEEFSFMGGNSVTITDMLLRLEYNSENVCNCVAEFKVTTEFCENYDINLTEGFVRNQSGQAKLDAEQIKTITDIIENVKQGKGE